MKIKRFFLFLIILACLIGLIQLKAGGTENYPLIAQAQVLLHSLSQTMSALAETDMTFHSALWDMVPENLRFILGILSLAVYVFAFIGFWSIGIVQGLLGRIQQR